MSTDKITSIFYSWQSDLPLEDNQKGIRSALKRAALLIEEKENHQRLVVDEATRDVPGSPDIPATIFGKISQADIFVADVTTINDGKECIRKTPNPNVLIELGYALGVLGWDRILMLYNKKYGNFPHDLPFDLDKRRVIGYQIDGKNDTNGKANLATRLQLEISSILQKNVPKKNILISPADPKRLRDIQTLTQIFSGIDLQSLDKFIEDLPDKIHHSIFTFAANFHQIIEPSSFHVYDSTLRTLLKDFDDAWNATLSHGGHYFGAGDGYAKFNLDRAADVFYNDHDEKVYHKIGKEAEVLKKSFRQLLTYVRENYMEVDIDLLSVEAVKRIVAG